MTICDFSAKRRALPAEHGLRGAAEPGGIATPPEDIAPGTGALP